MKRIKRLLAGIAALLCLPLCGCSMLAGDTAELLSPPELSGDIAPIAAAIAASAGGEYTLILLRGISVPPLYKTI